jgi:hypothetical protein
MSVGKSFMGDVGLKAFKRMLRENEERVRKLLNEYVGKYGSDISGHMSEFFVSCGEMLGLIMVSEEFLRKRFNVSRSGAKSIINVAYDNVMDYVAFEYNRFDDGKHEYSWEEDYQLFYSPIFNAFVMFVVILTFDKNLNLAHFDFLWRIKIW